MTGFVSIGGNTGPSNLSNGGMVMEHPHTIGTSWVFVSPFYTDKAMKERTIHIARSYAGVKEEPEGSNLQFAGAWYGMNGVPWCAEFASLCQYLAGLRWADATTAKGFSYCPSIVAWGKRHNRISRTPHLADMAVAINGSRPHHVELVSAGPGFSVPTQRDATPGSPVHRNITLTSPLTAGNDVGWVENRLRQLHYLPISYKATKRYGPRVHDAVVHFQRDKHLAVDGVCGPITAHHLAAGK